MRDADQFQSAPEALEVTQALRELDQRPAEPAHAVTLAAKPWRKSGRKLSPRRLYEHLAEAAALGALEDLKELLALGAPLMAPSNSPPAAWRRPSAGSALKTALTHGKMSCAAALLRQPEPLGPGVAQEGLLRTVVRQGSLELLREFSSPVEPGWPSLQQWLDLACQNQRMDLAQPLASLCPEPLSAENLDRLASPIAAALQWAGLDEGGSDNERRFHQAASLLRANAERVSLPLARQCFAAVIHADNPSALRLLLELGLRPSADWALPPYDNHPPVPLALLAYAQTRPRDRAGALGRCFELLARVPPIMRHALAFETPPQFLRQLSWPSLQELERMGFSLSSRDESGACFAHFWARESAHESLPKLKTLLKERPDLMEATDHDGLSPFGLALRLYPNGAREELRKAFVNLEKKEIKAEAAKPAGSPARSKPRL